MAREPVQVEEEQQDGAPEWMVTFSDCMTLLLTFFVLLLSYSSFSEKTFKQLTVTFGRMNDSFQMSEVINSDNMTKVDSPQPHEKVDQGSTTPHNSQDKKTSISQIKTPADWNKMKVFRAPSEEVFWAQSCAVSQTGSEMIDALKEFLQACPSRVVISEHGPGKEGLGFKRALAIKDKLVKAGVKPGHLSITADDMGSENQNERIVEITILETGIYSSN